MKWYSLVLLTLLSSQACDKKKEVKTETTPTPTVTEVDEPVVVEPAVDEPAPPAPTAAKTEEEREALANKALERIPEIKKAVAELRGIPFKSEVPAEYQNTEDFRDFVRAEIQKELPSELNAKLGRSLAHLGLIEKEIDLAKTLEDAMVTQAGAYYDPAQQKFFMVMVMDNNMMLDTVTSHELTHALQDQYFDLKKYYVGHDGKGKTSLSEDQLNARRFIVEGEATLIMVAYGAYSMAKMNILQEPQVKALRSQLNIMANMGIDSLVEASKSQATGLAAMGADFQKSIDAMDTIPLYIMVPLLESYMKGALPVYEAFVAGGWDEVDKLYTNPPDSTEQVLHPADKLVGKRDYPIALSFAAPEGWTELHKETIGELGWRVYFLQWEGKTPDKSAAGWDGDRVAVYEKDGKLLGLVSTTWDSKDDAKEFEAAYQESLKKRFPSGARTDGSKAFVKRVGTEVYVLDGASDESLMDLLVKTKKTKNKLDK